MIFEVASRFNLHEHENYPPVNLCSIPTFMFEMTHVVDVPLNPNKQANVRPGLVDVVAG